MQVRFLFIIVAVFISCIAGAQSETRNFPVAELFTIEQGLSQTRVNQCFVDSWGYLWIATSDGLNRYDGKSFKIYKYETYDSTSISNDYIRCISEDKERNLWIGTNMGLNFFNRQTGEFKQYTLKSGLQSEIINAVFPDDSGFVWVKTPRHLEKLNPVTGVFKSWVHYYDETDLSFVEENCNIEQDKNGLLWIGTKDGLYSFNRVNNEFSHFYHDPLNPLTLSNNSVSAILEDSNGELWIGTGNGLNKFDRINNSFRRFYPYGSYLSPSSFNIINSLAEGEEGTLWICSDKGVIKFNKRSSEFEIMPAFYVHGSLMNLSMVKSVVMDNSKILWIGGYQGIFKIDTKPRKFRNYNSSPSSIPQLSSDMISAIFKDKEGVIWAGLWNNGIDQIDRETGKVRHLSKNNPEPGNRISSNNIRSIYHGSQNLLWIGTSDGIGVYDNKSQVFFSFEEYFRPIPRDLLKSRHVFTIVEDNRKDLWFGTDNGIYRYQIKINTLSEYNRIYNDSTSIDIGPVYSIVADENKIWLGTAKNGLLYFDTENNIFINHGEKLIEDFPWQTLNAIFIDSKGYMWIGTPSGLTMYDIDNNKFEHFTEKDGLANNYIYRILEDKDGFLWMSSNKGLSRLDPNTHEFTNYGVSEGLQGYEFNFGVAYNSFDGEMFFGGISGFNSFYPTSLPVNPRVPKIVISSFEIIDSDGRHDVHVPVTNPVVTVNYNQSFSIDFAALDFTNPEKNMYKYSLMELGKEVKLNSVGTKNSVTFSNLSSGEYLFIVTGSNNDNVWNTEGVTLKIIVEAPFWRTRIAYILYIFIAFALVYWLVQFRTQSLRRSNRILRERDIAAKEVSKQKELLSRRNKNIEDSLNYAQRIQKAMLTTSRMFNSILPKSFILHKPKDIVSGDFYWISEVEDKIFVAAVDCTGHGVPGAFMSLIGFELFRKIINMQKITEPGSILDIMNSNFEEIFGNVEDLSLKDGMDLAFCVLDKKKNVIQYAGAFNPLYIIRDNKLLEIKGDRFSVGADADPDEPVVKEFKNHTIELVKDDMLYIFTDGFADQFGGPEGKKYKYRRFRHLLLTIHNLPLEKQKQYLDDSIEEWIGDLEQIDDILVIGIKPEF